jgi:hypothetical protein
VGFVVANALLIAQVSLDEAKQTLNLWYSDRPEVLAWQQERREEAHQTLRVHTLLGRTRHLPDVNSHNKLMRSHMERAAINTPVQVAHDLVMFLDPPPLLLVLLSLLQFNLLKEDLCCLCREVQLMSPCVPCSRSTGVRLFKNWVGSYSSRCDVCS